MSHGAIRPWKHHERAFQVTMAGETYTFDSFECAITARALTFLQ
ncbi:hypothetical protein [Notoacmeibacter sp. MSK16QG-6]|nr:hypothetical protein [Notoacmeibacter sp. MSK16QG-6]